MNVPNIPKINIIMLVSKLVKTYLSCEFRSELLLRVQSLSKFNTTNLFVV